MAGAESRLLCEALSNLKGCALKTCKLRPLKSVVPLLKHRTVARSLSQANLKQEDAVESVNDVACAEGLSSGDDALSQGVSSEMPFMVPTHVVSKGHFVHQSPRFFALRPNEKMSWLTKTYLTEDMPEEIDSINECSQDELDIFRDTVHQIAAFQRNTSKPSTTFHEEEFSLGLIQDLLRVVLCSRSASGSSNDLFLQRKPPTEMNWFRNFNFYHAKYQPSLVLRTDKPLPSLKVDFPLPLDEFPASMPGPFDTYSLGTFQASIVKLKNDIGVKHSKLFSKPLLHTVIQVDTRLKSEEFFQSCALMTSFTQLLASSVDQGHLAGLQLKEPMNCNCIITNGTSMMLMVYQLNTTELHDDRGMWNRAWCSPLMPLFTPNEGFPTKRQFHEISNTEKLEGFNPDAFKLFYKLLNR